MIYRVCGVRLIFVALIPWNVQLIYKHITHRKIESTPFWMDLMIV